MIVYFADRKLNIIGQASTGLPKGMALRDDNRVEDIETGIATFEGRVPYDEETRKVAEKCIDGGNYVFRYDDKRMGELFCITEYEHDNKTRECYFYAEDAGLSLLNEIAIKWPDGRDEKSTPAPSMTLTQYINLWISDTGFEIGTNAAESDTTTKAPETLSSADTEQSVTERIRSIANDFGYEISYSYAINSSFSKIEKQLVNIYKKRGGNTGVRIRMNQEVDKITVKGNLDNLATSLLAIGGTVDGQLITLDGHSYSSPDNDYVVVAQKFASRNATRGCLQSPSAIAKWGRLTKVFSNDKCTTKEDLAKRAAEELDKCTKVEVNYEIDIARLPKSVDIGDYVYIIDEDGELYLKARVLKLEESVSNHEAKATLGDYLIQSGGISQTVRDLAAQFEQIASQRQFYTWIAYADDEYGSGISLSSYNKKFIGIAVNCTEQTVDITDPTVFDWVEIVGDKLVAIDLQITSSAGQVFISTLVETTLTAHVYLQGDELTAEQIADIGVIRWYDRADMTTVLGTGTTYTVSGVDAIGITAQLEVEV